MSSLTNEISSGPAHHVHRDDEPLPGARGAAPAVDYSVDTMEHTRLPPSEEGETQNFHPQSHGQRDFTTQETREPIVHSHSGSGGGIGHPTHAAHNAESHIPGEHDHGATHPAKKATMTDKLVGKTEAVCLFSCRSILTPMSDHSLAGRQSHTQPCHAGERRCADSRREDLTRKHINL